MLSAALPGAALSVVQGRHAWCGVAEAAYNCLPGKEPRSWRTTYPRRQLRGSFGLLCPQILGLDKPAVAMSSGVDGEAAAPKLTQAQMEYNKMEAVLKDIEKRGTIRFD